MRDLTTVTEIETAIRQLTAGELAALRDWFAEFDADVWDRQIEEDVAAGRLNALADEAIAGGVDLDRLAR